MMKFLLPFLLTAFSFGSVSLVQTSSANGTASGTFTTGGTLTTTTMSFPSNTTSGSLLLVVFWTRTESSNATCGINPNTGMTITTSGVSWSRPTTNSYIAFQDLATSNHCGATGYYYVTGASVLLSSTTTTLSQTVPSSTHGVSSLEAAMFEFSGVNAWINENGGSSQASGAASTPSCSTSTVSTILYICPMVGFPGSNLTAASGYTLGPNAGTATIGQMSYKTAATGTLNPNYSGTLTLWATLPGEFSISSPATGVQRHRGSVF